MRWFLLSVAALHGLFMACELFPWPSPILLKKISTALPKGQDWTPAQLPVVATIVHNAGIYNAIIAGGLLWAAVTGDPARDTARVLLLGAAAAGIFGTATLKSPLTALQAVVGILGFVLLL